MLALHCLVESGHVLLWKVSLHYVSSVSEVGNCPVRVQVKGEPNVEDAVRNIAVNFDVLVLVVHVESIHVVPKGVIHRLQKSII